MIIFQLISAVFLVCAFAVCIGAMGLWLLAKDLGVIAPDDIPASLNRSGMGTPRRRQTPRRARGSSTTPLPFMISRWQDELFICYKK